jgi:hypothetical protein
MHMNGTRAGFSLALLVVSAACSKNIDQQAPLSFVPAETPYVLANIEALPDAVSQRWVQRMRSAWPLMLDGLGLDQAIDEIAKGSEGADYAPVLRAMLEEVRQRDTPEKWLQLGLSPNARYAIYGVGFIPVARVELADPEALRAAIARVVAKSANKVAAGKVGAQDVWTLSNGSLVWLLAIEGKHLVVAAVPAASDDVLKRRVLGLDKPAKNMSESGALVAFNTAHEYLPYGSGWVDIQRLTALFPDDPALQALAATLHDNPPHLDAACRADISAIAKNIPRLSLGYTKIDSERMSMRAHIELAPALAATLVKVGGAPPGKAGADSLMDLGVGLPMARALDFWVGQADSIAKSPFQCEALAPLNKLIGDTKTRMEVPMPPPLADFTGARISLDHFAWQADTIQPDVAGRVLIGSKNPAFLVNLAQMSLPGLAALKILPDGKPTSVSADALHGALPGAMELNVAMGPGALGASVGKSQADLLGLAVITPPGTGGVWLEASYSGKVYELIADGIERYSAMIPQAQRVQLESSKELYRLYSKMFKRFEMQVTVSAAGIDIYEGVEFAKP